ncbi:MAG: light-harvesting antenna LH1, beta subunit [Rhabdaerophilum sp.]|jgi:light-harvesting complex 1 beta chain
MHGNFQPRKAERTTLMADKGGSLTGLTENEAKEFHGFFMQGTLGFAAVSLIAHILIWMWRPWF